MNFKKILFSIVAYAMGSAMALIGIVFFFWFFLVSGSELRFYYGTGLFLLFVVGCLIYHFSFHYITSGWSDYL